MIHPSNRKTLLFLSILLSSQVFYAQEADRKVTRCSSVSRTAPVHNITVAADNTKWVSSGNGVFQVMGTELSNPIGLGTGEVSVLSVFGGNTDARWTPDLLQMVLGAQVEVSAAWYDERNDWLWLGTKGSGLFQLKTKPAMKLVEKYTSANSKLKSDQVTNIYQDRVGRYWVGTEAGLMVGTPGKWKIELDGYQVQRTREHGSDVYVLADGEFWAVRNGERWEAINVKEKALEGEAADFDLDPAGNLWILSHMVSRYDLETDAFDVFSGAELYTSEYGFCIAADLDGAVWVGTTDKGLYMIDKSNALLVSCLVEKELSCAGNGREAAVRVRTEGGKPPLQYEWSDATLKGENPQNLAAGLYTVTVTDSNGKSKSAKVRVEDPRMTVSVQPKQAESGPGKKDGIAEVTVKGGTPEYKYQWDNGETANPAKKLPEGTHTVTVTDSKGCSATATVTMTQKLAALTAVIQETTPIPCAGGNTILQVTVSGGKAPYQYEWSNPKMDGPNPNAVTAGTYQLSVVDAAGGKTTTSYTVVQPASINAIATIQGPANLGKSDGKATASARGGSGAYTYRWDNGETLSTAIQLPAGTHSVTVTDANGCTAVASVNITESVPQLTAIIEESGKIACNGGQGSLKVNVSGGKSPFQFQWNNPALSSYQPSGIVAGTYQVTVTDAANGKTTATITVKQPDPLSATATAQAPASTGNADGKAKAQAKGGTPPFQYKWDNGETADVAVKLAPGAHSVTATDANGCTGTAQVSITENILTLAVSLEETGKIACNGGKSALKANVSGGKGPFQFQWSNPALSGEQPAGISAGTYQLTVTDAANGKATATITVKQPDPLSATATAQAPASTGNADGKAKAQAKGGTPPFQYKWDNGETADVAVKLAPGAHSVTATDANGCTGTAQVSITENILPLAVSLEEPGKITCNGGQSALKANVSGGKGPFQFQWSNPALSGEQPAGISAGTYQLTVTDAANGKATATITVKQPDPLSATATAQAPASTGKADGKAKAQAKGGTPPFQYKWDNGETADVAVKLAPGAHSVTATDANGCTGTAQVSITENILPLAVSLEETGKIACNGGQSALKANVNGGKGPFQFQWSNPALSGEQPAGISAGTYQLTVTDAVGGKATSTISVKQPEVLSTSVSVQAPASTGNADGKAKIQASGGTTPYLYKWDNGETADAAAKLAPGDHAATVTDANQCSAVVKFAVTENILPLTVNVAQSARIKCAGEKASLTVSVSGGKPPFQYKWDNPAWSGDQVSNVTAGTYAVLVTDAKGTTQTAVAIVNAPDPLQIEIIRVVGATTERSKDGKATVKIKGGTAPHQIAWDSGETTATASKFSIGTHNLTVTDANGCTAAHPVEIKQRILPELNASLLQSGQTIRMEQLRFEADSARLTPDALPTLDELYDFMEENGNFVIEIGGHTNSTPTDEFCDRLSTARAKSAAEYLIGKGVDPKRVVYKGYGKRQPIASNSTPEGRRKNQRVEIKILSLKRQ